MKKLVFCLLAALPTVALIIAAIYVVSYASVPPMPIAYEGGSITTYDAEIGFVARKSSHARRTDPASPRRPAIVYDIFTDDRGARVAAIGKSPPKIDIMSIGCSMTWGHGVQHVDTYAARLADHLGVTVSNFAMGSYGTVQSLQMLGRHRDLAPKVVIYGFITDHLRRNITPCASAYYPFCLDISHAVIGTDGQPRIKAPRTNGMHRTELHMRAQATGLDPITWVAHGVDVAVSRLYFELGNGKRRDDADHAKILRFLLTEMDAVSKGIGAQLIVIHIPLNYDAAPAPLIEATTELNVPLVDLTGTFRALQRDGGSDPYILDDGHISAAGHALIAEALAARISAVARDR